MAIQLTYWSGYLVQIPTEESFGGGCTPEQAEDIAGRLARMVMAEFPGVDVRIVTSVTVGGPESLGVSGPSSEICREIWEWIRDNWESAC